tara:strand:- start:78 stop:1352 length:1275 start_codon:yes stop_codon:yes gene_type:complete
MYEISVIGLGYVGLPLAVEFSKYYKTIGYDINSKRIEELNNYLDITLEISKKELKNVLTKKNENLTGLFLSNDLDSTKKSNIYIITVPTPIDSSKKPNLNHLIKASTDISKFIKKNDIIIYESTVYPGATEEICVPILEKHSKLKFNSEFFVGYSPERINPGDKKRKISKIIKVTSGSTKETATKVNNLYKKIITAGTHLASSIKVAEASKVIENTQRDINIAFVNELAKIFKLLNINTNDVLQAAKTKWNFLPFKPGLVGGHCIGIDPYYLADKAQDIGYYPEIILAARRLNDSMGFFISSEVVKEMIKANIKIKNSNILVMGVTYKEDCPDTRNSKVIDIINKLYEYKINIDVYDPLANMNEVKQKFNINIYNICPSKKYNCILIAVAHKKFLKFDINNYKDKNCIIYDVKGILNSSQNITL